jgi:hypothetical protein
MTLEWFPGTLSHHLSVSFTRQFTRWTIAAIFDQPAPIGKLRTARSALIFCPFSGKLDYSGSNKLHCPHLQTFSFCAMEAAASEFFPIIQLSQINS